MFNAFALTLREIAELLLIVAALRLHLRQQGRADLARALFGGVVLGLAAGALLAGWGSLHPAGPPAAALLTIGVALGVTLLTSGMLSSFGAIRVRTVTLLERCETLLPAWSAPLAVGALGSAIALRESVEVGVLLTALQADAAPADVRLGAMLGVVAAALLATLYRSMRIRLNLHALFRISALLMSFVAIGLLLEGIDAVLQALGAPPAWQSALQPFLRSGSRHVALFAVLMCWPVLTIGRRWWSESSAAAAGGR